MNSKPVPAPTQCHSGCKRCEKYLTENHRSGSLPETGVTTWKAAVQLCQKGKPSTQCNVVQKIKLFRKGRAGSAHSVPESAYGRARHRNGSLKLIPSTSPAKREGGRVRKGPGAYDWATFLGKSFPEFPRGRCAVGKPSLVIVYVKIHGDYWGAGGPRRMAFVTICTDDRKCHP